MSKSDLISNREYAKFRIDGEIDNPHINKEVKVAVHLDDITETIDVADSALLTTLRAIACNLEEQTTEQKLTNLYLSKLIDEELTIDNDLERR